MHPQNLLASLDVRAVNRYLAVKATRTQQRRVKDVGTVGCRNQDDGGVVLKAIHLDKHLVERLLALVVASAYARAALTTNRVNLVDEDDGRGSLFGLLEQVAHAAGTHANEHLDKVGAADREERHASLSSHRLGEQGLARSRWSHQQNAMRNLGAHPVVALGIGKKVAHFLQLLDSFVNARDVGKLDLGTCLFARLRLGAAKAHGLAVLTLNLVHKVEHDDYQNDGGQGC